MSQTQKIGAGHNVKLNGISVSNDEFITGIFGADKDRVHVCGFSQDPHDLDKLGLRHYWAGGPAWQILGGFKRSWSQYFAISTFKPDPNTGRQRRIKALHELTYVITFDDVGVTGVGSGTTAKVPWTALKLPPSYVLETSPGNFQVGYVLAFPEPRAGKVSGLLDLLVGSGLVSGGKDPGMKGVTRYVRLPEGSNTKTKYVTDTSAGFPNRMAHWAPGDTYTLEDIAEAHGFLGELEDYPDNLGSGTGAGTRVADPGSDILLDAMARAGIVRGRLPSDVWDIECPFIEEHTGRADSGSAYLGGGYFKCHHGHCEDRPHEDFVEKFKNEHPDAWTAAWAAGKDREFGDIGGSRDPFADLRPGVQEWKERKLDEFSEGAAVGTGVGTGVATGGSFTLGQVGAAGAGAAILNQNWLVKNLFPQVGLGMLWGAPKTGKTFVAMDLAFRVGFGMSWYGHMVKRPGTVVYVSSEGGRAAAWNRAVAWMQKWDPEGQGCSCPGEVVVYPGTVRAGRGADDVDLFLEWLARENLGPVLVVIDTLNKNMVGDENSTEDMTAFVSGMDKIWRALSCFVLVVHHSGKDESKGARGSGVMLGAVEAEIVLTRDKEEGLGEPGQIALSNLRHAEDGKKYGFVLEWVKLGVDEDLEDVGTLIVAEAAAPRKKIKLGKWERLLLDVLVEITDNDADARVDFEDLLDDFDQRLKNGTVPGVQYRRKTENRKTLQGLVSKKAVSQWDDGLGIA